LAEVCTSIILVISPRWGTNWDRDRCHDEHWYDGDPHDLDHRHGSEPYPGGPGVPGSPGVAPW